ncbi:inositol monophosphatase family protein [Ensifer soli]|uniref:inositol monophosphatase family protein n=1 Tax=Ciceribacter sp. sgz301302 TaxID=3342379 RepID=UPI0035B9939D
MPSTDRIPALDRDGLAQRLATAKAAATAAGDALLAHYARRDRLVIDQKGVNDFVSQADREAEDIIAAILRPAFPQDGFLGEETGLSGPEAAAAVWCVDPLDGTTNFLKGAHNWCVSIGLWAGGAPVVGVIHDPVRGETFAAAAGLGATMNGTPISVTAIAALDQAAIGVGHNRRVDVDAFTLGLNRLLSRGAGFRQVGAGALMLAYVAAGRVDAYAEGHMLPWDAVAGLALIREAGGALTDYLAGGRSLTGGGPMIAGSPALVAEILAVMGETIPARLA